MNLGYARAATLRIKGIIRRASLFVPFLPQPQSQKEICLTRKIISKQKIYLSLN
jgi:hypothetical protein